IWKDGCFLASHSEQCLCRWAFKVFASSTLRRSPSSYAIDSHNGSYSRIGCSNLRRSQKVCLPFPRSPLRRLRRIRRWSTDSRLGQWVPASCGNSWYVLFVLFVFVLC